MGYKIGQAQNKVPHLLKIKKKGFIGSRPFTMCVKHTDLFVTVHSPSTNAKVSLKGNSNSNHKFGVACVPLQNHLLNVALLQRTVRVDPRIKSQTFWMMEVSPSASGSPDFALLDRVHCSAERTHKVSRKIWAV